jgi:choice-of-anchor B domain-containing protein
MFKYLLTAVIAVFITGLNAQENYNLEVRSHLVFPGKTLANIGGYADSLNNEYALVGTSTGLSIVNVTDPENPFIRFNVAGVNNFWREVKTWEGFAYVTTEGNYGGLTIVDMRQLPDTILTRVYRGNGSINNMLGTIHALHIDSRYCYLYGSNIGQGGVIILDLLDPWNPVYVGRYDEKYVHDGYVYGDTLWAGHIYDGTFGVIDVSDKANPISLVEHQTPNSFTHNTWLTDSRKTLLTTDEVSNSYLASYDIQDLNNITELDRYQTAAGSGAIVHNTHVLNDYAVTSWYTEGVVVVDAARPNNLIEVGKNDFTSFEGDGFNGCWGVYPFLPSGNMVASDIENGLYVLTPNYVRACYLEGIVRDSSCGAELDGVTVSIVEIGVSETTGLNGIYRTGTAIPGTYTITFSKPGYQTKTYSNVELENGVLTEFEVDLFSSSIVAVNGLVDNTGSEPVADAVVAISNTTSSYQLTSDVAGNYSKCDLLPGDYQVVAGKWGFVTNCQQNVNFNTGVQAVESVLEKGYYDDFQFNFGWTSGGTASSGLWARAIPAATDFNGTPSNPGVDVDDDCNGFAYVTGNTVNAAAGDNDVDGGSVILSSPWMDLSTYVNPRINLHRWFFNAGGSSAVNDTLYLRMVPQNGDAILLKKIASDATSSAWVSEEFRLLDYVTNWGIMKFEAEADDFEPGHLVEAGIDQFYVWDSVNTTGISQLAENEDMFKVFPNPSHKNNSIIYELDSKLTGNCQFRLSDISGRIIESYEIQSAKGNFPLSNAGAGIYFLQLLQGNRILQTERIIRTN